uniref:Uncharacterized protein n=1 Tax=Hanusia phi TaxID=3032 RepID=A0A7S0F0T4_9CRYP
MWLCPPVALHLHAEVNLAGKAAAPSSTQQPKASLDHDGIGSQPATRRLGHQVRACRQRPGTRRMLNVAFSQRCCARQGPRRGAKIKHMAMGEDGRHHLSSSEK